MSRGTSELLWAIFGVPFIVANYVAYRYGKKHPQSWVGKNLTVKRKR